jgi:hypothetical protein
LLPATPSYTTKKKTKESKKTMRGTNSVSRDEDDIPPIIEFVAPYRLPLQEVEGRKHGFP